jgi:hypothetical protein
MQIGWVNKKHELYTQCTTLIEIKTENSKPSADYLMVKKIFFFCDHYLNRETRYNSNVYEYFFE